MSFPQGGDFPRQVASGLKVVSSDPETDQGNSVFYARDIFGSSLKVVDILGGVNRSHFIHQFSSTITQLFSVYKLPITKQGSLFLAEVASQAFGSGFVTTVPSEQSSFWRMVQLNPGVLPHLPNVFSDLYVYDVFSGFLIYNKLVILFLEALAARLKQASTFSTGGNLVQTDYYSTIIDEQEICVGDEEPPFIVLFQPISSGIPLRPPNQIVDFSLIDEVGGVDLSTVQIDITSTTTTGTINIVDQGIDQTGGYVTVIGNPSAYRFTYTPPFLWQHNDKVVITISGADLIPEVDNNPFFCGLSDRNFLLAHIPFAVLNDEDISAEITVIGDVSPPFLNGTTPGSGTVGNSVFTPVIINIADTLTGVDLSTVTVTLNATPIVIDGQPQVPGLQILGGPSQYVVYYQPPVAFAYGSTATVTVFAKDRVEIAPPNELSVTYDFSFIGDSTLVIENFKPLIGTHALPYQIDIEVDVRDDTFDVDEDQTFFVINGTLISGTRTPLASGVHLTYHPPNDFAFDEPIRITVHGTNANTFAPVVKESFYTLYFGYRIFYFNDQPFSYLDNVDVFVRARNLEIFPKDLSTGYFFTTYTQPHENLGASIEAFNPIADLPTTITGIGPEHHYGQTVTVQFSVEDFEGHLLGPYTFVYTIENKP